MLQTPDSVAKHIQRTSSMIFRTTAILAIAALLSLAASAQDSLDDRLRAYADRLWSIYESSIVSDEVVEYAASPFYPSNPDNQELVKQAWAEVFASGIAPFERDTKEFYYQFLKSNLSETDLRIMLDFEDSPAGQRIAAAVDKLSSDSAVRWMSLETTLAKHAAAKAPVIFEELGLSYEISKAEPEMSQ